MAVKTTGSLSLTSDIRGEFGGSTPHSLSEYKRGGSYVPNGPTQNNNIPTSNSNIQFSDYYGAIDWSAGNQTFTSTQSWTPPAGTNSSTVFTVTLVAGGGGGGGGEGNGGGGGGGYQSQSVTGLSGSAITITILKMVEV